MENMVLTIDQYIYRIRLILEVIELELSLFGDVVRLENPEGYKVIINMARARLDKALSELKECSNEITE